MLIAHPDENRHIRRVKAGDSPQVQRLRLLRAITAPTQRSFAAFLGITYQRWNNVEQGHPLSRDVANRLVMKIPGLTLDWLYSGNRAGLSVDLDRRLTEAAAKDNKRPPSRGGRAG